MNVLSIGNSFSQDAQRYLHQIARCDGFKMNTFNLYIGGCPLSTHYRNMLSEQKAYTLEMNGVCTDFYVSLKEALLSRNWDVITIQQVSNKAPYYDTYQPYLNKIIEYVRLCVPKAKIAMHQTWAYEQGSKRLNEELGYANHYDMYKDIEMSCDKAAKEINADYIIPSGKVFQKLLERGIETVHRDTFHAEFGYGRFALGLIWYTVLTGRDISNIEFNDFDVGVSADKIALAKCCVKEVAESLGTN